MKLTIILGTRPEIIKFSPIIRVAEKFEAEITIVHTGQHYSYNLDRVFFKQLELPEAQYNLEVGSGTHAEQTGRMLINIEQILKKDTPNVVLVQGDTNTTLAGALAAVKLGILIGHVEAGLRSYDRTMPEEINRILADHASDFLFAPTENSKKILLGEGIPPEKIFVTGNTVVDALNANIEIAEKHQDLLGEMKLIPRGFFLTTVHRQENVDNPTRFRNILKGLELVNKEFRFPIIYPIHPRSKKQMKKFGLKAQGIKLVEPLDYLRFLLLEKYSQLILTDSGGIQEEACVLQVPCVTLRENTERPETLQVGSNVIAGTNSKAILENTKSMMNKQRSWSNPFGDGKSAHRILGILTEHTSSGKGQKPKS
jgi:UDP-N-acetylglucosamine 2-epimerase (non-hydrolysing)